MITNKSTTQEAREILQGSYIEAIKELKNQGSKKEAKELIKFLLMLQTYNKHLDQIVKNLNNMKGVDYNV